MKFTFEAYNHKSCLRGVPVLTTKWTINAENEKEAHERAKAICERLTNGNKKDWIEYRNLKIKED